MGQTQRRETERRATIWFFWGDSCCCVLCSRQVRGIIFQQFFGGRSERFVFQVENDLRTLTAKGSQKRPGEEVEVVTIASLRPRTDSGEARRRSVTLYSELCSSWWREPLWPLWRQRKANNTRKSTPRGHFSTHQEPWPRIGHAEHRGG